MAWGFGMKKQSKARAVGEVLRSALLVALGTSTTLIPCRVGANDARAVSSRPFSVADGITSTRFATAADGSRVFSSPNGHYYAVALISGDVGSNKVWLDVRVGEFGDGTPTAPISVARLSITGLGDPRGGDGTSELTMPRQNAPRWIDDRHIAFLWADSASRWQVYVVDVVTHQGGFVTHAEDDVMAFATSPSGALVIDVRDAPKQEDGKQDFANGFAVSSAQLPPLMAGYAPGTSAWAYRNFRRYIGSWKGGKLSPLLTPGTLQQNYSSILTGAYFPVGGVISPDGNLAFLDESPFDLNERWKKYNTSEIEISKQSSACDIRKYKANRCLLRQLFLVDLKKNMSFPLVDAPFILGNIQKISWSPSGYWAILGPTYLPESAGVPAGSKGWIIVDLKLRKAVAFPRIPDARSIQWIDDRHFTVSTAAGGEALGSNVGSIWSVEETIPRGIAQPKDALFVVEDLNHPPKLQYTNPEGTSVVLLDPNPQLASAKFASVEMVTWSDSTGAKWEGRFYKPNGPYRGPWPLVIQTHGYAKADEFSLYGPGGLGVGLGPGWSIYLAQALATRGIAVLQVGGPLPDKNADKMRLPELEKLEKYTSGIAAGVNELARRRVVDPSRVGLEGHSATGRLVEYALTRGSFRYAAAIVSDAADLNYLQQTMYGYGRLQDLDNNALPLTAPEMVQWIARSPALNADRVQTPIQYDVEEASASQSLMWHWEMYSALKSYGKPVEYFVLPDILHGTHYLQNPRQIMIEQSRALDWWLFWLKGEEDSDPAKRVQYQSWEQMRPMAEKAQREPRRPLLEWSSKPQ